MLAQLQEQAPDLALPPRCQITWIHDAGDEGGIVCKLDFGTEDERAVFVVSMRPTRSTALSACVAATRRRPLGHIADSPRPAHRDQPGLVNIARKSSSARCKPPSVNTTDLALLTGSSIRPFW